MKYDLQIIVPCVKDRLECFQKYGLHNIGDVKVLLYCLVDNKKDFASGWPSNPNLTVELVEYPECEDKNAIRNGACYKLFKFLYEFTVEQAAQAKWTLKMDDDVYNDIESTLYFLDKDFDHEKNYYIAGETRFEMENGEIDIARKLNLLERINENWQHELESCVLSNCAMQNIISNEDCKSLFKEKYISSKFRGGGYTDQMMGMAAKLCKIYPVNSPTIINAGRESQLPLLLLNKEEKFSRKASIQEKLFCHFHPLKDKFYKAVLEIEMRRDGASEEDIRAFFPTPTITPTLTNTRTITPTPSPTPNPTSTPTQTTTTTFTVTPTMTRFWFFNPIKTENPTPTPTLTPTETIKRIF